MTWYTVDFAPLCYLFWCTAPGKMCITWSSKLNLCSPVLKFSSLVASLKGCTVLCLQTFRILQTRFRPCLTSEYFPDSDQDSTTILWNFKSRYRTIYYMFELFKMLSTSDMEEFDCSADSTCFQPGLRSYIESFRHGARTSDCDKNVLKQPSKHSFLPKIQHVEVQREPSVICARSHHMAASVWVWNALCSCLVLRLRWGVCVS